MKFLMSLLFVICMVGCITNNDVVKNRQSDTTFITEIDTVYVSYVEKDTIQDTLLVTSTDTFNISDSLVFFDSIKTVDTLYVNKIITNYDTLIILDTIRTIDSIISSDSIIDSVLYTDTLIETDTVVSVDTLIEHDTIITVIVMNDTSNFFIDKRNFKAYRFVTIGSQNWMAENLNYEPNTGFSWCLNDDIDMCSQKGRLYTWETAIDNGHGNGKDICPDNWHLPTDEEWKTLEMELGMTQTQADTWGWRNTEYGKKLLDENLGGTDDYLFTAIVSGYRTSLEAFNSNGIQWWVSNSYNEIEAHIRGIPVAQGDIVRGKIYKSSGLPVRCVRN